MSIHGDVTIPAFVIRGLATFDDVSDPGSVRFSTEAELRDALATTWWLHGMAVRVEVDVPKCGRIDVLGRIGNIQMLVELKREVTTVSQARKAMQQASTYRAFLNRDDLDRRIDSGVHRESVRTEAFVTCASANWELLHDMTSVFQGVDVNDYVTTAYEPLNSYLTQDLLPYMRELAQVRSEVIVRLSTAARIADRNLSTALEAQNGIAA